MKIGVIFQTGDILYIDEVKGYGGCWANEHDLVFVEDHEDAFNFVSLLEFKVSVKNFGLPSDLGRDEKVTFVSRCIETGNHTEFDLNAQDIEVGRTLEFNRKDFRRLITCPASSSHTIFDKDGNHYPFNEREHEDKIVKIKYYTRGLTNTIQEQKLWAGRRQEYTGHRLYKQHHPLMMNPIIQQIYLLDLDKFEKFTIFCNEEQENEPQTETERLKEKVNKLVPQEVKESFKSWSQALHDTCEMIMNLKKAGVPNEKAMDITFDTLFSVSSKSN